MTEGTMTQERVCIMCGKPLPPRRRSYCSDECRDDRWQKYWADRVEEGKRAIGYRPMTWPAIAAEQLRLHPVCQQTGDTQDLEVHHIRPLRSGGTNELSNLITLSHKRHLAQHRTKPRKNDPSRTLQEMLPL
jgi:5-methylcytosine-specific restriction endonuclease McrA